MKILFFQLSHILHHKMVEYLLSTRHDLIISDGLEIFGINDIKLGQIVVFIFQFIGIVQQKELYGREYEETENSGDLMCRDGILHCGQFKQLRKQVWQVKVISVLPYIKKYTIRLIFVNNLFEVY